MKVYPVRSPLNGEEILAVQPEMKPVVDAGWRRRLNLFAGRTLSDKALTAEQKARAARLALLGAAVTRGVAAGLEIGLETGTENFLHVSPGLGITAGGEDVRVLQPLRLSFLDLRVNAPVSVLDGQGVPAPGPLAPRRLGGSLRELGDQGIHLASSVAIVLLEPVVGERVGDFDATDPCERDPRNEAFEDQQLVDGCRVILWSWPTEWLELPKDIDHWRNALAWQVFFREADLAAQGEILPWEKDGVPLGLFFYDPISKGAYLDRFSVVRSGGDPMPRTLPGESGASPSLWQARIQQYTEQLTQLQAAGVTAWEAEFRYLPPFGPLPVNAATFGRPPSDDPQHGGVRGLFPDSVRVTAAPVPMEELEPVYRAAALLDPIDRVPPNPLQEGVQILVPVPRALYDPDLLVEEKVSPELQAAIDDIAARRGDFRLRRDELRARVDALLRAEDGKSAKPLFDPDPGDSPGELGGPAPDPPEDTYDTDGPASSPDVPALRDLEKEFIDPNGAFFVLIREVRGDAPGSMLSFLRDKGIAGFTADLNTKLSRADDRVDLGFLETQTAIYKVRQLMLGNTAGTRLAVNPSLAQIAQGESAASTRRDLQDFLIGLRVPVGGQAAFGGAAGEGGAPAQARLPEEVLAEAHAPVQSLAAGGAGAGALSSRFNISVPLIEDLPRAVRTQPLFSGVGGITNVVKGDIVGQSPIVGQPVLVRGLTVAERLKQAAAKETKDAAVATKYRVVTAFLAPELLPMVFDLPVPGLTTERTTFTTVKDKGLAADILRNKFDPDPQNGDESAYFSAAVKALDDAVATLRVVEGRLQLYRSAVDRCQDVSAEVAGAMGAARTRLDYLEKKLAEARHDLAVATALLEEEKKRVEVVNQKRKDTLDHHVTFLVYHRIRTADLEADVPVRPLDPAPLADPLPVCRALQVEPPPELRSFVGLLREAPVRWFQRLPPLLERLDRLDVLYGALQGAKVRAASFLSSGVLQAESVVVAAPPPARATVLTLNAQREVVGRLRNETAQLDLSALALQSWRNTLDVARRVISIGDLLDVPHGRPQVAQISAQELEQITQVAACLYADFGEVLPTVRLDWVERLSEFDQAADLRRLSSLPRWQEVDALARRDLQGMVDWLFQRIDQSESEAVATISDLVRVALLLASHAPVDRIVAGHVAEATTTKVGGGIKLQVDHTMVRIGMHVLLFDNGNQNIGRAVVEDVGNGSAQARVIAALQDGVKLAQGAGVQFIEPPLALAAAARGK